MALTIVTILYLSLLLFTILFQMGLILGKPWGEWTMGGYHKGALPTNLRVGAFISILILSFLALIVIDQTQVFDIKLNFPDYFKWIVLAFNFAAVIANSITKSKKERKLWQPITILMLICSLIIFLN